MVITMPKAAAAEGRPAVKRHASSPRSSARLGRRAGRPAAADWRQQRQSRRSAGHGPEERAPVSKEVLKVTLPKSQEADLSNGVHLIVARGSPHAAGLLHDDHRRRRRLLRSAGDRRVWPTFTAALMREGHDDENVGADLGAARSAGRHRSASAPGSRRRSRRSTGSGLTNNLDTVLALDGGRADEPVVPAGGDRSLQDAHARRLDATSVRSPAFLAQERLNQAVFGDHPVGARVADARGARRADPRRAGRVPQGPLRARSRRSRRRRRHLAGAGEGQGRSGVRRVEEVGRDDRAAGGVRRRSPVRRSSRSSRGPTPCRPACRVGTQSIERTDPGLRRADRGQPHARRRPDRPAVRAPARAEGLHLRRLQRLQRDAVSSDRGPRPPTCARRSPTRP